MLNWAFNIGRQGDGSIIGMNGEVLTREKIQLIWDQVSKLPISGIEPNSWESYESIIRSTVKNSVVTIISIPTWWGKTSQVPKYLRKLPLHLVRPPIINVTQPRIIATINAASRLSEELIAETSDPSFSLWYKVWYRTGKEVRSSRRWEILFTTDAFQLNRHLISRLHPDILIVDEVHNFSVSTEFLLAEIARLLKNIRKDIRLVLMSATIDINKLVDYYSQVTSSIWAIDIPGKIYDIEEIERTPTEFTFSVVEEVRRIERGNNSLKNGLVFVEWKKEIEAAIMNINQWLLAAWLEAEVVQFHSELSVEEQKDIFKETWTPRVIVSTNIAEWSITLPDLAFVVDTWRHKIIRLDRNWVPMLCTENISKANQKQRKWRVWRVDNGRYIDIIWPMREFLLDYSDPEIKRVSLTRYILLALSQWIKMNELSFVHNHDKSLQWIAIDELRLMWAIDKQHKITEIWLEILKYPLDPEVARMLVEWLKKWCSWDMITLASIINSKWFLSKNDGWKKILKKNRHNSMSDILYFSDLFKVLTSYKIDQSTYSRLENIEWINIGQLKEFNEQDNYENRKMLFEIVDLSSLWIKSKKIYNILETITNLEQRIEWNDWKIEYSNNTDNKLVCLLTWLYGNIYSYDKEHKVFYHKNKWHFYKANTSILEPSVDKKYIWFPFIIGWTDESEDFPLLQLISWITYDHIKEVDSDALSYDISWLTFWVKTVENERWNKKRKPCIRANITTKIGWTGLWDIYTEVPIELREQAILGWWLPDFLINSNSSFLVFIRNPIKKLEENWVLNSNQLNNLRNKVNENKKNQDFGVNIFRLRQVIKHVITSDLIIRIYLDNWAKTEVWFMHDTQIFQRFMESWKPAIKQFLKNPFN